MHTNRHGYLIRRWGVRLCLSLWWSVGLVTPVPVLLVLMMILWKPGTWGYFAFPMVILVPVYLRFLWRRSKRFAVGLWRLVEHLWFGFRGITLFR